MHDADTHDEPNEAELGSQTSEQTQADLDELVFRRADATGRPVVVIAFSSTADMDVFDVEPRADDEAPPIKSYTEDFSADEQAALREPGGPLCQQPSTATERAAWRATHPELCARLNAGINEAIKATPEPPDGLRHVGTVPKTPSPPPQVPASDGPIITDTIGSVLFHGDAAEYRQYTRLLGRRRQRTTVAVTTPRERRGRRTRSGTRASPARLGDDSEVEPPPLWWRLLRRLAGSGA
jgi:hypothetical protein